MYFVTIKVDTYLLFQLKDKYILEKTFFLVTYFTENYSHIWYAIVFF